jgi:hypothetical protein
MKKILITCLLSLIISCSCLPDIAWAKTTKSCPQNVNKLTVGDECKIEIINLHPTQSEIGIYQVKYNEALLGLIEAGKSPKYANIQEYLTKKTVPVVIGPNNTLYMVDRHHTVRAVWDYFAHASQPKIYIKIIQNWSEAPDFWQKMKTNNYTYLGSNNQEINPEELPDNIGKLVNNNYRSAVGLAVKWTYLEEPKGEAQYFYQFKWGDCLQRLGFFLPTNIQRDEVYATAAFLHDEDNQAKFGNVCHLEPPHEMSLEEVITELES